MITIPEGSKCKIQSALLCDWRTVLENDEIIKEECRFCGKKVDYNKRDGRIDNVRYLSYHLRDALQPSGASLPLYIKIYGSDRLKARQKKEEERLRKQRSIDDIPGLARSSLKTMQQKTFI